MKNKIDYYDKGMLEQRQKELYYHEKVALKIVAPLLKKGNKFLDVGK